MQWASEVATRGATDPVRFTCRTYGTACTGSIYASSWCFRSGDPSLTSELTRATIAITYETSGASLPTAVDMSAYPSRTNLLRALVGAHLEPSDEHELIYFDEYRERHDQELARRVRNLRTEG